MTAFINKSECFETTEGICKIESPRVHKFNKVFVINVATQI